MTDPTTRTITTATTAPITVPDPLPKGPSSPFAGRTWDDVAVMLLSRMDDISVIGSWFEEDARRDDAALLGETLVTTVIGIAAKVVIGEGEAANVIDRMELLVTSEDARRDNAVLLCETLVATLIGVELLVTSEDARGITLYYYVRHLSLLSLVWNCSSHLALYMADIEVAKNKNEECSSTARAVGMLIL